MVAHFIARIAEHHGDFPPAHGQTLEDVGKAIPAQDGEEHHKMIGKHRLGLFCNLFDIEVVSLGTCKQGLGHADDVTVLQLKPVVLCCSKDTVDGDVLQVIPL
ncbi:hypothetical protein SDC9_183125 [bioreactor metagenome]|uniref:Uncharacterized protein n=1 Tax=bioreactor metagenome TaxID=1076179 RepID=A0A645H9E5_9ZZZZ